MSADFDFENFEDEAEKIRDKNYKYLDTFGEYLEAKGLKDKTIQKHLGNIDFYINTFLLKYEILDVRQGCYKIDDFLGNWFIRKAMRSNAESIKSNITSMKMFYGYLLKKGVIDNEDYDVLCGAIFSYKDHWLDLVRIYNDPEQENPFLAF